MENIQNEEMVPKKSMNTNSMYYGLLTSIAVIVYYLITYVAGLSMNEFVSYPGYIILIVGIVMGTIAYRDKHNDRFLTYGKSFTSGFLIGLYASIIGAIWTFIFFKFIGSELIPLIHEKVRMEMLRKNPNISEDIINMQIKYITPLYMAIGTFFMSVVFSAISGLIAAAFIKKEEPQLL